VGAPSPSSPLWRGLWSPKGCTQPSGARSARMSRSPAERAPTGRFPDPPATGFTAAEVVLYRSDLGPDGARYTALARGSLGDPEP
jgi:hypothetical protein